MIGKLFILFIMSVIMTVVVILNTEPKSEIHAKAKFFLTIRLFQLQKMVCPQKKLIEQTLIETDDISSNTVSLKSSAAPINA